MIENDFVQTPKVITEMLLMNEKFEGTILEPCCGKGAISNVLLNNGYNVISQDKIDYGFGNIKDLWQINEKYDNIITNPPFTSKVKMVKHLLEYTNNKLVLLWYVKNIGNVLESKNSKHLRKIYIINQRIDWKETKLGWLFAWYVWDKNYIGETTIKRLDTLQSNLSLSL